ncbi:MAG TPA: hypothetical protein VFQ00_13775 [Terriglobales bacterium]|nr:hypothetical protein [Terriglobales bacterium]
MSRFPKPGAMNPRANVLLWIQQLGIQQLSYGLAQSWMLVLGSCSGQLMQLPEASLANRFRLIIAEVRMSERRDTPSLMAVFDCGCQASARRPLRNVQI